MLRTKMEVDVCVALISRRTKEEDNREITELQDLDSLVDRGTDKDSAGEPEEAAGELNDLAPVELNTQGDPGEVERNAMTTGSLVERGLGPWQTTLPNFSEDLAQSVSELLPEILPSSQFDGALVSAYCVAQGDERTVMSGIYRPEIEFEPVNNRGSNSALGVTKGDCDENRPIGLSQNDSDTFNDTLETREGNKGCLVDCNWDKEHDRNCGCVTVFCSPAENDHRETGFEIDCNSVASNVKDLSTEEMNTSSTSEGMPIRSETSIYGDLGIQCGNEGNPQVGSAPDLKLEEQTLSAETTSNKVENMCISGGCAEITSCPDTNAEQACSHDRNIEITCSQDINAENMCSCDNNSDVAPDKNSEIACGSDRSSQLSLSDFPVAGVEGRADSLSPTVNLDFGAVYWTKDKSKSDKDEESVGNVVPPPCRRALRVTFASEEGLVSGCLDPAIPWMEAWLCSTPELVAAYKSACESVGVKPLKKLLVQLEGVKRFDVRSDLLSLKGESLDWKHCETLEAIFKRVQFNTINMEEMRLDDEVAVTIFDLLQYYQSCVKLIMNRSTNLGTRGWQAWTRLMKQSTGLQHLEARGLSIPDHTLPVIGKYLRTGSMLRTLQLENSIRSGRHLNLLASAMKTSQSVHELYLGDNQLMPADGLQLGTMLKGNNSLHLLDLRNNFLQDTGMGHICDGVADQNNINGLNTLVIWNNQVTHQSMPALSRALAATKSLETLNIGHNNITNDGIHRLKDGLMQNKTLLRIGLQATKISCEGAVALAEFVAESLKLVRLDLRENSIRTGGLMALSLSLKVNQTVTCVDLDKEPKKESGMKDYAEQQKRLLSDIISFAARNSLQAKPSDEQGEDKGHDLESPSDADDVTTDPKNDADDEGVTVSASVRPTSISLTLSIPTRCETLESPNYWPDHLSLLTPPTESDDVKVVPASASLLYQRPPTACESGADAAVTGPSSAPPVNVASVKLENSTAGHIPKSLSSLFKAPSQDSGSASAEPSKPSTTSAPPLQKPLIPEKPAAPLDKKLVRTKRKFTISRAVLPSALSSSPKPVTSSSTAVLFTARPTSVSEDGHLDSDTHVCIVGTSLSDASSNSGELSKKSGNGPDLHPLVKKFSSIDMADVSEVTSTSDSKVVAAATVDGVRSDSSVVGASVSKNQETVAVEMAQSVAAEETVVMETSQSVAAEEPVVMETSWSVAAEETVVVQTSWSVAAEETVVLETSRSVAAETGASSNQKDVGTPKKSDVPSTLDSSGSSAFVVSDLTPTPASVSTAVKEHLDLNIPKVHESAENNPSTNVAGDENHLPIPNDVLVAADPTTKLYPAERDQSVTDGYVVGRDHSVVSAGIDCSLSSTEDGQSLKRVFEQLEHSLLASVNEAESVIISVANESLECSERHTSDPKDTAILDVTRSPQVNYDMEDKSACTETRLLGSSCSAESVTSFSSAGIQLERWSTQTEDGGSPNIFVQVADINCSLLAADAFKTLGNNGQDCYDLSLGLDDDDFKKSNGVSSSDGTDTAVSDCDEFLTATEESESDSSDMESTRRKTGSAVKSVDDKYRVDTALTARADDGRVFERDDRFLEAVSTAVSSFVVSEAKLVYNVNNLKHDVLDSVNANTSTAEH